MQVTATTWVVALLGLAIIGLLATLQLVAAVHPRADWTIRNVYGSTPERTDPTAYFAYHLGQALADVAIWAPLQIAGSVGMLLGERWGFLLALMASVPYVYTAVLVFVWDRDMEFRKPTLTYWLVIWGMFPAFGLVEAVYCWSRLA